MGPSPDREGSTARDGGVLGVRSKMSMLCASVLLLVAPAIGQQDPVNNFCRRFGHQTAVVDSKLYIDGGLINWNINENPSNYSSTSTYRR